MSLYKCPRLALRIPTDDKRHDREEDDYNGAEEETVKLDNLGGT